MSGLKPNTCNTWSNICRCCPVTQTRQSRRWSVFKASANGANLIASGRVPKIRTTFGFCAGRIVYSGNALDVSRCSNTSRIAVAEYSFLESGVLSFPDQILTGCFNRLSPGRLGGSQHFIYCLGNPLGGGIIKHSADLITSYDGRNGGKGWDYHGQTGDNIVAEFTRLAKVIIAHAVVIDYNTDIRIGDESEQ